MRSRDIRPIVLTGVCVVLAALFLGGCATSDSMVTGDHPKDRAQIARLLTDIFDAAQSRDMQRLDSYHWYGPNFTKFGSDTLGRQDAAAARKGEHDGLAAVGGLSMQARELKIDVFGNVALATFILDVSFRTAKAQVQKQERSTMVFLKKEGVWKITHEHFSPFEPAA